MLLVVPGMCYRRDVIDRYHVAEPHQLGLWRIRRAGGPLGEDDLAAMIERVTGAVLPGRRRPSGAGPQPVGNPPWAE